MKIGATDVEVEFPPSSLFLPQEVLASTTLLRLSLSKCRVEKKCVISCSSLKSLALKYVLVKGDVFEDILRCCCISLEELSLYGCRGLALRPSDVYEFRKLRSLFLYLVDVNPMFFTEFASRFPCLKDLALHFCGGCKNIQIASTSLQTISFEPRSGSWGAKFDVPNIRKVTHSIFWLPSQLYINAAVREWEFDMSICSTAQFFEPSWLINLKKYLTKLRPSRILLNIDINNNLFEREDFEHEVNVEAVPKPLVVENLMISAPSSRCCALLLHLFGICRPKFVTHNWFSRECDGYLIGKNESLVILWKRLMKRLITPNSGIPDRSVFGKFGLEKVNLEVYEMFDAEWRPLLLEKPLDPSKDPERKRRIRFELIWED